MELSSSSSSSCLRHASSGQLLLSSCSSSSRFALLVHGTTLRSASGSNAMRMRPILRCVGGLNSSTSLSSMLKLNSDGMRKDFESLLRVGAIESGGWGLRTKLAAGKRDGVIVHASASAEQGLLRPAKDGLHLAVSMGLFIALDKYLKSVFIAKAIRFPSALFGMLSLFAFLTVLSVVNADAAQKVESFMSPATSFIQRWLPLFYVPSLVVVPLAVKGIPAAEGAKIGAILVGGWIATLLVAGFTAVQVRNMVKTELLPAEPVAKAAPFTNTELFAWTSAMLLSFGMAVRYPTALGPEATTAAPFLLAATVVGYLVGTSFPAQVKKVLHPIITCAVTADAAACALGVATGKGFGTTLGGYLTKNAGSPGAGDLLMGFLGSVILSFAFSMFRQREVLRRHAAEILTAVVVSSLFSLFSTAAAGRFLGLIPSLTCSIIPRCVTVALALPIASLLEGSNPSLTAAVVVLTGLVGANFTQLVMDNFGFNDPISRGMATASSAHGLGTAALAGNEPEALPYCAIAYALTGIVSTILCATPPVRTSLLMLAGAI